MLALLLHLRYPDVLSSPPVEQGKRKKPERERKTERMGGWQGLSEE
jgi:hypothetical protein